MAKDERKPRVVLTEGAIFHPDHLHDSVPREAHGGHQKLQAGDLVMLNDEEFERHRAGGVCLGNPFAQAAE